MSAFIKKYPRAKVSRHQTIDGWVIDLLQREGAKPRRVAATYVTAEFAARAALVKLGHTPTTPLPSLPPRPAPAVKAPTVLLLRERCTGACEPCGRPMRPVGTKASEYPGTVLRQREGICQSCHKRETVAA